MLAGIKKRLGRRQHESKEGQDDDDKDEMNDVALPTNYIKVSQGKVQLVHHSKSFESATTDLQNHLDKAQMERRLKDVEATLERFQELFNAQCELPTFEKDLREQLENMNRLMKSKERKQQQTFREHKVMQSRFARQESILQAMKKENNALLIRVRQYEHCLDDVMRKVVDAIVAEDSLRLEVSLLKERVRDLEEQNAVLSASSKGRDEGYCTMSSGPQQPSNGHLEDLPEEPEQFCATEMEDWSMSQEELAIVPLEEHQLNIEDIAQEVARNRPNWLWSSNELLSSTLVETDSVVDGISQLLQQKIIYSEDEEVTCTEFTNDFYKLVNIRSSSARSLYSCMEAETDEEGDDDSSSLISSNKFKILDTSPTPSEAGRAHLMSGSSSDSDELSNCIGQASMASDIEDNLQSDESAQHSPNNIQNTTSVVATEQRLPSVRPPLIKSKSTIDETEHCSVLQNNQRQEINIGVAGCAISANIGAASAAIYSNSLHERIHQRPANSWRKSNGWKRVNSSGSSNLASPTKDNKPVGTPAVIGNISKTKLSNAIKGRSTNQKFPVSRIPSSKAQAKTSSSQLPTTFTTTKIIHSPSGSNFHRKSKIPPPVPVRRSYVS